MTEEIPHVLCSLCGKNEEQYKLAILCPNDITLCNSCVNIAKRLIDEQEEIIDGRNSVPPGA